MKRIGEMIRIKPEGLEAYKKYHANPLPGVNEMITACNIRNYTIYQRGDYLFASYEYVGDDFEADMCLAGENGCGKSTLVKIISGVYTKDEGEVVFEDKVITKITPAEATKLGIQVIYQDLSIFPNLTVMVACTLEWLEQTIV